MELTDKLKSIGDLIDDKPASRPWKEIKEEINQDWFEKWNKDLRHDPVYIREGLLMSIFEVICKKMKQQRLSVKQFAAKLGWSHSYLLKIFRGEKELTLKKIAYMYSVLKIDESEYFKIK
jgi:AraC-like DNA-binding protein